MPEQPDIQPHSILNSIAHHLIPGVLIGIFFFLAREPFARVGFPSIFALMLAIPLVLVPVELGVLLLKGKQRSGRLTLEGVVGFRSPIPAWQLIVWSLAVFVAVGLVFTVMKPVDTFLQERVFSWVPALDSGLDGGFSRTNLIVTYAAVLLFGVIVGPIVEELYFRGYLLPRTPGRTSILWHSLLFAVYHVFTPWMIVTRTIGLG